MSPNRDDPASGRAARPFFRCLRILKVDRTRSFFVDARPRLLARGWRFSSSQQSRGRPLRDPTHVRDIARVTIAAAADPEAGPSNIARRHGARALARAVGPEDIEPRVTASRRMFR